MSQNQNGISSRLLSQHSSQKVVCWIATQYAVSALGKVGLMSTRLVDLFERLRRDWEVTQCGSNSITEFSIQYIILSTLPIPYRGVSTVWGSSLKNRFC